MAYNREAWIPLQWKSAENNLRSTLRFNSDRAQHQSSLTLRSR